MPFSYRKLKPVSSATWNHGEARELAFWDEWLQTKGSLWPEDFNKRLDRRLPLDGFLHRFIAHLPQNAIRILDLGAGPVTIVGRRDPPKKVTVVAVDPLAHEYDALLARYGINPPIRTVYAELERLVETFGQGAFDLVFAQNSVDHTSDPLEVIRQMLLVAKANCFVVLRQAENEGAKQNYEGVHQWNFRVRDGEFIIETPSCGLSVSQALADLGVFRSYLDGDMVVVEIQKREGIEQSTAHSHSSGFEGEARRAE